MLVVVIIVEVIMVVVVVEVVVVLLMMIEVVILSIPLSRGLSVKKFLSCSSSSSADYGSGGSVSSRSSSSSSSSSGGDSSRGTLLQALGSMPCFSTMVAIISMMPTFIRGIPAKSGMTSSRRE